MNRDFEKEYKEYVQEDTPDLWSRIEPNLKEKEINATGPVLPKKKSPFRYLIPAAACACAVLGAAGVYTVQRRNVKEASTAEPAAIGGNTAVSENSGDAKPVAAKISQDSSSTENGGASLQSQPSSAADALPQANNAPASKETERENALAESYAPGAEEVEALYDSAPAAGEAEMLYESAASDTYVMSDQMMEAEIWEIPYDPSAGESYAHTEENGFSLTQTQPLSTFSADVDTASYANVRRMIEDGYTVDEIYPDAVRIEEFVNYFSYDLKKPEADEKFGVTTKIGPCPWNEKHSLLMIGLATEAIDLSETQPENLTFLLDVSGSMADDDKLPLLQRAFTELTAQLDPEDTVSIVTYANGVEVVLDSAAGSDQEVIRSAIESLMADGGTYGEGGIQKAYELAEKNFDENKNNRILLATDGDLNIGISDPDGLEKLIREKRDKGIYLSVLGFGTGNIRDDNMERLADCGNGNYSYIDSILEARKVLVQEMGATFHTVAEDVKLQVEFNPAMVNAYHLVGYENRMLADTDFTDDTKDAGEIGAGHTVIALYELIPTGSDQAVELKYQNNQETEDISSEYATLKIRYKEPGESSSVENAYVIDASMADEEPDEDFIFASMAAEFAMILKDSEYKADASLEQIVSELKTLDLTDEYKEEFYYLVKQMQKRGA